MAGHQDRLAARIRAERKSRGQSREDAARLAGISFRQYQRWESGQSDPRDGKLRQLAEAWGLTLGELRPPDPEHEERDVRDQLNRVEAKLDALLTHAGLDVATITGDTEPSLTVVAGAAVSELPPEERAAAIGRREAERTRARRPGARKAPGAGEPGSSGR